MVRFYFDFTSPYTYLASTQVNALAARTGAVFDWIPALLGGVMKATGNQAPALLPARAAYMAQDLPRWAELYGVPFLWSPHFPLATITALRVALFLKESVPAAFAPFVRAAFRAAWGEGKNLGDRALVSELAREAGADAAAALAAADDPRWKDALKRTTEAAVASGVFGMPAFVLGEGSEAELYFGNDRLVLLEERLRRGRPFPRMARPDVSRLVG